MKKTYLDFALDQWIFIPPVRGVDLSGKTVVVVGANTGIGFESVKHFARMNPTKLVVASHNKSKAKSAVTEIELATGYKNSEPWKIDLTDFASVTSFAERFQRECDRLDILVMNPGIGVTEYAKTFDGWESSLQVNHLSTALLSLLLLPRLVDTGRKFGSMSHLVIVASDMHYWAALHDDVIQASNPVQKLNGPDCRDSSSMEGCYNETKHKINPCSSFSTESDDFPLHTPVMNVLFARALQDRLGSTAPLSVNAPNPGFCRSNLRRESQGMFLDTLDIIMKACLAWTPEQGSRQLIYAAIGEQENEDRMKGVYISNVAVTEPSDFVISEQGKSMQDNHWRETIEILMRRAPQLKSIVQEYLV